MDQQITIELAENSQLRALYGGALQAVERTTCNYGLSPGAQDLAGAYGMRVAATDATGEVRAIERVDHPFFLGTLYQPQLSSRPGAPHPIFAGLLAAAARGPKRPAGGWTHEEPRPHQVP
jgi:CTP synthase (UTP-ammonia lyase)